MDKNNNKTNKTEKNNQKGMNRTEFGTAVGDVSYNRQGII